MSNYEMMFIIKSNSEADNATKNAEEIKKIVSSNGAKVVDFKELGLKKLAYPIKKEINGYYFLMHFTSEKNAIAEINRKISINENVLRHLIIKLESE